MKVGESGVQSHPQLQSKDEAGLGYKDPVSKKKKQTDRQINKYPQQVPLETQYQIICDQHACRQHT